MKHLFLPKCLLWISLAALVACGKDKSMGQSATEPGDFVDKGVTTPAGQYPIIKKGTEPITLSLLLEAFEESDNYQSNAFTQWLREKTGVLLDFIPISRESMNERVNILLASGDLPDIMTNAGLDISTINFYGNSGLLRSFAPYIEKYGSVIKDVFQAKPIAKPMVSDLSGNIYALPRITECYHCFRGPKAWYYKPWLDKLDLAVPQTTEQFYEMLAVFKTQDPNGNGKADEIPYTGSNIGWDESNIIDFIAGSFLYIPGIESAPGLALDGRDSVISPFAQPEYREALRYLNRLYEDGLISDLTFTMSSADYKRTVGGAQPHIVGVAQSNYPGVFADFAGPGDLGFDSFYSLAPLEGPGGVRYANLYSPYQGVIPIAVMSVSNPYPALSFRLLETFMLSEGSIRAHIGVENTNWWKAPTGSQTATGEAARWVSYDPQNPEAQHDIKNKTWPNIGPTIYIDGSPQFGFLGALGLPPPEEGIDPDRSNYETILGTGSKNYYQPYNPPTSLILPPLTIPEQFADEVEDIGSAIRDYIGQESVKFIRGENSFEDGWDNYLQKLEGLGLPRYLEIYQAQYEAEKERWAIASP